MNDFDKAVEFTLEWEGGYTNDLDDPGGETNWGISKKAHPDLDIFNLTREQAVEIYREEYWKGAFCDTYSWPLNLVIFDTAVNCGVGRTLDWLLYADNWKDLLLRRINHYVKLNNKKYLQGWLNRCMVLYDYAVMGRTV